MKLLVILLFCSGCTYLHATVPTPKGTLHVHLVRPIWTNYNISFHQTESEMLVTAGTRNSLDQEKLKQMLQDVIHAILEGGC